MTMLDSDFNLKQDKGLNKTIEKYASSATDEHKKQLLAATVHKGDIPFEHEAEKKMQVYEAARRLEFPAFMEWMFDKKYFIGKL